MMSECVYWVSLLSDILKDVVRRPGQHLEYFPLPVLSVFLSKRHLVSIVMFHYRLKTLQ